MRKDYEKLFAELEPKEPPAGLFDRIILAINEEQELRHTKRLLFGFFSLLPVSLVATPLSGAMLVKQTESAGISHFISAAVSDLETFFALWQDFVLAVLESLPIAGIVSFLLSLTLSVFTLRLFLRGRGLLFGYLRQSFNSQ